MTKRPKPKLVRLAGVKYTDASGRKRKRYAAIRLLTWSDRRKLSYALFDREKMEFPLRRETRFGPLDYWKIGNKRWVVAYIERTTVRTYELQRKLQGIEDALDRCAT